MRTRVARLFVVLVLLLHAAGCGCGSKPSGPGVEATVDPELIGREVAPQANPEDPDDITRPDSRIWVLHFRFKDPQMMVVDTPGGGRKTVWYMWYQVVNKSDERRIFIPDFELVTQDKNTIHHDQILRTAEEAIKRVEDPTGSSDMKNSVTIADEPIPPARPVTGLAIWDDVDPDVDRFSVFVSGLSNGCAVTDPIPPSKEPVIRRKTLELEFRRLSGKIQIVGQPQWIYRATRLDAPLPK